MRTWILALLAFAAGTAIAQNTTEPSPDMMGGGMGGMMGGWEPNEQWRSPHQKR